ncbi:hypothetical protein GH714_029301 [Hevea brasiliensis]|uniref:Uncharacterized protein n=1 Tax=Hevea brasiliensis TaxID=3981 RepID=A0A6A6N7T9_HEVBR|nr:hypothetical protein GH714_029301 [Hevea brasiliensis]
MHQLLKILKRWDMDVYGNMFKKEHGLFAKVEGGGYKEHGLFAKVEGGGYRDIKIVFFKEPNRDLNHNYLTGSIPSSLGNLSSLEGLHLGFNSLSGPIPRALGSLSNLRTM